MQGKNTLANLRGGLNTSDTFSIFYYCSAWALMPHTSRWGFSPVFGDEPPSSFKVPHCGDSRTLSPSRYSPSAPSPNASTTSITATAATGIRPLTGQPSKPRLTTVVIGHERYPAEVGRPRGRTVDALSLLQAVQDITWRSAAGDWLRVTKTTSVHWRTQQLSGVGRGAMSRALELLGITLLEHH